MARRYVDASRSHFRNRLRHEAIPSLSAALGRDARPALVRTALLLAEDDAWMNEQADLTRIALEYQDGKLSVTALRQVPTALTRRILRSWMRCNGVPNVGFDEVEQALVLLGATGRPSSLNLPGAWRLRRRAGLLFLDQPGRTSSKRRFRSARPARHNGGLPPRRAEYGCAKMIPQARSARVFPSLF